MQQRGTTTKNRFRTEDVTFRHARRQSEIDNEIEHEEEPEQVVKPPVSLTPEQVMDFYKAKIAKTSDSNEKRVYSQTIIWIKDLLATKKALLALREKAIAREEEGKDLEDIVE